MGRMAYWQAHTRPLASLPLGDAHPGGTWPYARGEQLRGSAATTPRAAGLSLFCFYRRPLLFCLSHGRHSRRLGRVGDLADDLDDVAVRVERPPLAVGAVSAPE